MASPAEILRVLLMKDAGLVDYPGINQDVHVPKTQCFINVMPDDPPQALCLADTAGRQFGSLTAGRQLQHYGIKINMRHEDPRKGHDSIKAVKDYIENFSGNVTVRSRGMACNVGSLYNTSSIVSLGLEVGTRRNLWSMSVMMAMQDIEETPVEE